MVLLLFTWFEVDGFVYVYCGCPPEWEVMLMIKPDGAVFFLPSHLIELRNPTDSDSI
jgi:hypothetical protein